MPAYLVVVAVGYSPVPQSAAMPSRAPRPPSQAPPAI
jgi:hypothetical protein